MPSIRENLHFLSMPGYTVRNLKDVEDAASGFGLSPGLEARFATVPLECERLGLSYQRLAPNFRLPFGHRHREQEEVYVLVSGSGRVKLDDEVVELRQWDAVRVASGTMRSFEAGPEGAGIIAVGAPRTGVNAATDVDMTPDWWSEAD
jgi:mannose-6-phosphate isomerase-like protein (cupin superfamily)